MSKLGICAVFLLCAFAPVAVYGSSGWIEKLREKRSLNPSAQNRIETAVDCFDAFKACRRSPHCQAALSALDEKCKVAAGSCSAKMVDLPRCGKIMDHLFAAFGTPDKKCRCDHTSRGCSGLTNRVYGNKCFASIKILRQRGLFPKEIDAYDQVVGYVGPSSDPLLEIEGQTTAETADDETIEMEYETFVAGEYEPPTRSHRDHRARTGKDKTLSRGNNGDQSSRPTRNPGRKSRTQTHRASVTTQRYPAQEERFARENKKLDQKHTQAKADDTQTFAYYKNIGVPQEKSRRESDMDFKLVAIVLGSILGVCILSAVIFFAWTKKHGVIFFTSGKLVYDYREDDGMHVKSAARNPTPAES